MWVEVPISICSSVAASLPFGLRLSEGGIFYQESETFDYRLIPTSRCANREVSWFHTQRHICRQREEWEQAILA